MNTKIIQKIEESYLKKTPELKPGDTVRVHQKIKEGNKERIQIFEGVVLKICGGGIKTTFLVRKISFGVGIEKSYPLHSPNIAKIEVKKRAKVRKAYLTYLRKLQGKSARLREKGFDALAVNVVDEPEVTPIDQKPTEPTDAEITELSEQQVAEAEAEEIPLDKLVKEEEKKAESEDKKDADSEDTDHQVDEIEEVEDGIRKAEEEQPKEKDSVGKNAEKAIEETPEKK
jgi:large subunit ribosomal protein L19